MHTDARSVQYLAPDKRNQLLQAEQGQPPIMGTSFPSARSKPTFPLIAYRMIAVDAHQDFGYHRFRR
jgi:hypothetical protein